MANAQATQLQRAVVDGAPVMRAGRLGNILSDEFFQYAIAFTFPAGTETFNQAIPVQSDAHFMVMSTAYTNSLEVGNIAANTSVNKLSVVNGGATVQLTDNGNQHFLSSQLVPVNVLFGSGELPHIWEMSHLFRANTGIGVLITGTGAAVAGQVIRLVFSGMKIPKGSRPELGL